MSANFVIIDDDHILHKMGIIINLNTLNIIYTKVSSNNIKLNDKYIHLPSLMLILFNQQTNVLIENIYYIDDNIFNTSLENLEYRNNNLLNQNLFLNNNFCLYTIVIEKYNYKFELMYRYTNFKNTKCIFSKNFLKHLFMFKRAILDGYYYILSIHKMYIGELIDIENNKLEHFKISKSKKPKVNSKSYNIKYNNMINYYHIKDSYYYISDDSSHIINLQKKK